MVDPARYILKEGLCGMEVLVRFGQGLDVAEAFYLIDMIDNAALDFETCGDRLYVAKHNEVLASLEVEFLWIRVWPRKASPIRDPGWQNRFFRRM